MTVTGACTHLWKLDVAVSDAALTGLASSDATLTGLALLDVALTGLAYSDAALTSLNLSDMSVNVLVLTCNTEPVFGSTPVALIFSNSVNSMYIVVI